MYFPSSGEVRGAGAPLADVLGAGLINPYRSLTEWGGPRDSELPGVVWSGEIWVSGDYVVPEGAMLTIAPGTTVYIANFDNEAAGIDPQHVEISAGESAQRAPPDRPFSSSPSARMPKVRPSSSSASLDPITRSR